MKVGIIGAGFVGTACAKAMLLRGSCHEIVLLDIDERRAQGVSIDLSHGEVLCSPTRISSGNYDNLKDSSVIVITAGINEQAGEAIDRNDNLGRLRLLPDNALIYKEIIPNIVRVVPNAPILVVTDPPDPLADVAREITASNQIISAGTFLDTLRFKIQIAKRLNCHPSSVDAMVIGEHGTSQVYVWSSARVGGELVLDLVTQNGWDISQFMLEIEKSVKYANIEIIEGTGASQHGIGIVVSRIIEAILRDEGLVIPIGIYNPDYSVTLSLPSVIDKNGVSKIIKPTLSDEENIALKKSASSIINALTALKKTK